MMTFTLQSPEKVLNLPFIVQCVLICIQQHFDPTRVKVFIIALFNDLDSLFEIIKDETFIFHDSSFIFVAGVSFRPSV